MSINVNLAQLSTLNNTSILGQVNANNAVLQTALTDAVSRSGQSPNQMLSNLDMNSNQIINLPPPATQNSPVRLADINQTTISIGTPVYTNVQSVPANSILGNNTGSVANAIALTGAQTEQLLQFTASGTGAVQRLLDSKDKDIVSVKDFGAVGNGVADDSTAIQNAINSLTGGGLVYFPAGVYGIGVATTITLPTTVSVCLMGSGRGSVNSTAGTTLKALTNIPSMIKNNNAAFSRGHRITNMTIDGQTVASIGLQMDWVGSSTFDCLDIINNSTTNFRLGTSTLNAIENVIFCVRLDNPINSHGGSLPSYNFDNHSTNCYIGAMKAINASVANVHSASTANNNVYCGVHGYNFDYTSQIPTTASQYNFLLEGTEDSVTSWEGDGSSVVIMQLNGNGNMISNGTGLSSTGTVVPGIQFANLTTNNVVYSNTFNGLNPIITQAGAPFSYGNIYFANINKTAGGIFNSRISNTATAFLAPGSNGTGSSIANIAGSYAGKVTTQNTASTSCTVGFGMTFTTPPVVTAVGLTGAITSISVSTTQFTVNFASTSNFVWNFTVEGT